MTRPAVLLRAAAEVVGVAALGVLHAAAAGAVVTAGFALAAPDVVEMESAGEAAAQSVAFGLASLRVPLEAGGVHGTFAPLTGLVVTLWGLGSAAGKAARRWPGGRTAHVTAVATAFGLACATAATMTRAADADASVEGAALAGAVWGAVVTTAVTSWWAGRVTLWGRGIRARGGSAGRPNRAAALGLLSPRRLIGAAPDGPAGASSGGRAAACASRVAPGAVALAVALALAAAWFAAALLVFLAGVPARAMAGGILLGLAVAPNAAAALVAVGLGGRVEMALEGTALADPMASSASLWDWAGRGLAPPHVLLLVVAVLLAVIAAGRTGAATAPGGGVVLRGLRLGALLGAGVVAAGWLGSFAATAGAAGEATIRLGFEPVPVFGAALAWGVAGAWLGPRLPWPRRGGR